MNKIHRLVGILTVAVFLITGIYMKINFPGLYAHNEEIRFMFRANHIYILLAGLLNIAIGTYFIFTLALGTVCHVPNWFTRKS